MKHRASNGNMGTRSVSCLKRQHDIRGYYCVTFGATVAQLTNRSGFRNRKRQASSARWTNRLALLLVGLTALAGVAHAESRRFETFNDLQTGYLQDVPHWIVQARNGQDILESRHRQHSVACLLFSMGMIAEHLNYSRFEPDSHYDHTIRYSTPTLRTAVTDVGYFASSEYLAAEYEAYRSRMGTPPEEPHGPLGVFDAAGDLNTKDAERTNNTPPPALLPRFCDRYFQDGVGNVNIDRYGQCTLPSIRFEQWLNAAGHGCRKVAGAPTCRWDAQHWMFGFLNLHTVIGCNDARPFSVQTNDDVTIARMIIKGFIDNDVPLIMSSRGGAHFMVVIGYADIDDDELPRAIIVSNPQLTRNRNFGQCPGPKPKFWVYQNLDDFDTWTDWGVSAGVGACSVPLPADAAGQAALNLRRDAFFGNVRSLVFWNQHLNGGCDIGGWARRIDAAIDEKFGPETSVDEENLRRLCTMPPGYTPQCQAPNFGVKIDCKQGGRTERLFHTNVENPFITEPRPTSCESINVSYADGGNSTVIAAEIERWDFDPITGRWSADPASRRSPSSISTPAAIPGRTGSLSSVVWRQGQLGGDYDLVKTLTHRTRVTLEFNDGATRMIEIAPPNTYGIGVRCERGGTPRHRTYHVDPDRRFFEDRAFVVEPQNTVCDNVYVSARLGDGRRAVSARIKRLGRNATTQDWELLNSWAADESMLVHPPGASGISLSGENRLFAWTSTWRDNYRWVARDVPGDHDQRKVQIELTLADGSQKTVEIIPAGDPTMVAKSRPLGTLVAPEPPRELISENVDDVPELQAPEPSQLPGPDNCPGGTYFDAAAGECVLGEPPTVPGPDTCPLGTIWDHARTECVAEAEAETPLSCIDGTFAQGECQCTGGRQAVPVAGAVNTFQCMCPAGETYDVTEQMCLPGITCQFGTVQNNQCVCTGGRIAKAVPDQANAFFCGCPEGQRWDQARQVCVERAAAITCQFGTVQNNQCVCTGGRIAKAVPNQANAFFCGCPEGQRWDRQRRRCIK